VLLFFTINLQPSSYNMLWPHMTIIWYIKLYDAICFTAFCSCWEKLNWSFLKLMLELIKLESNCYFFMLKICCNPLYMSGLKIQLYWHCLGTVMVFASMVVHGLCMKAVKISSVCYKKFLSTFFADKSLILFPFNLIHFVPNCCGRNGS
jgi:hypothetical protein